MMFVLPYGPPKSRLVTSDEPMIMGGFRRHWRTAASRSGLTALLVLVLGCKGHRDVPAATPCSLTTSGGILDLECGLWGGARPTYGLGWQLGAGPLDGSEVLIASAPCYVVGDEHVGGVCASALFELASLPFGEVGESSASWTNVENASSPFELEPPGSLGSGAVVLQVSDEVHRLADVPSSSVELAAPGGMPASALFSSNGALWIPMPCGDVDGDGQAEVCRWFGDFGVFSGPLAADTESTTPLMQAAGVRGPVVHLAHDGGSLFAFGQPLENEGSGGVKILPFVSGSQVDLAQVPTLLAGTGYVESCGVLKAVDFDGDGRDELVVASALYGDGGGEISIVEVVSASDLRVVAQLIGGDPGFYLGASIDAADLDGDGLMDLVVGAPNAYGSTGGLVHVWFGPPERMTWENRITLASGADHADRFGTDVAVAMVNGRQGIAVGAPLDSRVELAAGSVFWFDSSVLRSER